MNDLAYLRHMNQHKKAAKGKQPNAERWKAEQWVWAWEEGLQLSGHKMKRVLDRDDGSGCPS